MRSNMRYSLIGTMLGASVMGAMIQTHSYNERPAWNRLRGNRYKIGRSYAPNGKAECERRARQIACGQLKAENGLVLS